MNNQKPAIPMRNLVIFMIISLLIMFGWNWLENRNKPRRLNPQEQREVLEGVAPLARMAPAGNGLGDLTNFVAQEGVRQLPPEEKARLLALAEENRRKVPEPKPQQPVA